MQYRALRAGARVARLIGRETDDLGYDGIARLVLDYTQESRRSCQNFHGGKTEFTLTFNRRSGTKRKDS
jgi:hypothetical protein